MATAAPTPVAMANLEVQSVMSPQIDTRPHSSVQTNGFPGLPNPRNSLFDRAYTRGPVQISTADGVTMKYQRIPNFIGPVQVVASVLDQFFKGTLQQVATAQQQGRPDPGKAFTLNIGSLNLAIRAAKGSDRGNPWSTVNTILDIMFQQATMVWTSEFVSLWTAPGHNILLYVSLSVLRRIGPRPMKPS